MILEGLNVLYFPFRVVSPIRWRFTYLCWNIPIVKADRPDAGAQPRTDMPNIPGQADSQRLLRAGTR
jgi:hypothetical protein